MTGSSTRQPLSRAVPRRRIDRPPEPVRDTGPPRHAGAAQARALGNTHLTTCAGGCGTVREGEVTTAACPVGPFQTCSGGCAGCATDERTLTPAEDFSDGELVTADDMLHTQGPPAAPAPAPVGDDCSPKSAKFTSIPSGKLTPTFSSGKYGKQFDMKAEFETPIPCTCVSGEYRQFVRGYAKRNGTAVVHRLCGNTMSPTTWYEDCMTSGGTDLKYGYHSIPFGTSKFSNPDQATGCTYTGFDHPGFPLGAVSKGDLLEIHLEFEGRLVDASAGDRVLRSSSWSVEGTGTVP